jgi:molybdopterin molybdotransferase
MLTIEQAEARVADRAAAVVSGDFMPAERVPLGDAHRRVLRDEVRADTDSPPFRRSIRDGFAVRAEDVARVPRELDVIGESRAGLSFDGVVGSGLCAEIMTGAEVPAGADAVVMIEDTERLSGSRVRILKSVDRGRSVQDPGTECHAGDLILSPGRRIHAGDVGILASLGRAQVAVSRKPTVAIVSTGDELVGVDQVPGPAQIRNSNSLTLAAEVAEAGGDATLLGIARDDPAELREKIGRALGSDIVITSGGVSMGKYDLVAGVFRDFGVQVEFEKVAMKPGKPTVFGWKDRTFVFGLPGNPVSTIVSFRLFIRPLIRRMLHSDHPGNTVLEAELVSAAGCDPARAACVPAAVCFDEGRYRLEPVRWKGSSDLVGLAKANAYALIPRQDGELPPGTRVRFLPVAPIPVSR